MLLFSTLKYFFQVRGYRSPPPNSLPSRMGCSSSDMFRLTLSEEEFSGGVSLYQYHAAFLSSPLFQTELWLLSWLGYTDPIVKSNAHLMEVASGEKSTFGPWTAWAIEGNRNLSLQKCKETDNNEKEDTAKSMTTDDPKKTKSACQIMRCYISGVEFCDTWWAVERAGSETDYYKASKGEPELVFGTNMLYPKQTDGTSLTFKERAIKTLLYLGDPVHRIYSCLLLANTKARVIQHLQTQTENKKEN